MCLSQITTSRQITTSSPLIAICTREHVWGLIVTKYNNILFNYGDLYNFNAYRDIN